ncbi:MAG: D-alanine--D-alanine ligase [Ectothiorhodospiraceae bacterium]|nr:D-alanine--D-alanine ligase [Ectothiorhodospiraceae bacterium]
MGKQTKLQLGLLTGDPSLPFEYGPAGVSGETERKALEQALTAVRSLDRYTVTLFSDHEQLLDALRARPPELMLNLCDAGYRNRLALEPNVPALLELLGIPHTGAGPVCMSLCSDKAMVRLLAATHGIPVPSETFVDLTADPLVLPALYPALIKPNAGCGSIGVSAGCVVNTPAEADVWLRHLADVLERPQALIQDFLTGSEYTLGLVGNPDSGMTILPALEIDYSRLDPALPPILTYESKVDPDSAYWQALRFRKAELHVDTEARMIEHALFLFERLGLRDYARIDFRAGPDGVPRLLDVNFNPTWHWDGKLAVMAGWAGHTYPELIGMILEAARQRYAM